MAFDGLMTSSVAASLKESLLAGRINKIYQLSNHEILMQIRAQGKNQKVFFQHIHLMLVCKSQSLIINIQMSHRCFVCF